MTGADRFNARETLDAIKANRDKLDACPRHSFEPLLSVTLGQKVECKKCGGMIDLVALNYYVRGYEAAGQDGNDILPGWREPKPEPGKRTYFAGPDDT